MMIPVEDDKRNKKASITLLILSGASIFFGVLRPVITIIIQSQDEDSLFAVIWFSLAVPLTHNVNILLHSVLYGFFLHSIRESLGFNICQCFQSQWWFSSYVYSNVAVQYYMYICSYGGCSYVHSINSLAYTYIYTYTCSINVCLLLYFSKLMIQAIVIIKYIHLVWQGKPLKHKQTCFQYKL